ncbi:cleavage stimulation factor [Aphelenchoides avenae]|nr:cleavage stimulation factor [Aphelenchus avenae]
MTLAGVPEESPYGPEPELGKAPEAIARTVASMPPERMFELMKQMKEAVTNNPTMARQLLLDNPQLAYALLQAQVVMRVVDPKVAFSMLHRETPATSQPFHQAFPAGPPPVSGPPSMQVGGPPRPFNGGPPNVPPHPPPGMPPPPQMRGPPPMQPFMPGMPPPMTSGPPPQMHVLPPPMRHPPPQTVPQGPPAASSSDSAAADDEQLQAQMLIKVLQLTDEQIRMLPPEDRAKVIELRNQLRQA